MNVQEELKGKIVQFTPAAVKQIIKLQTTDASSLKPFLRLGVKSGGCSGLSYIFEFDQKQDQDIQEDLGDFSYIVDPTHASKVLNLEVDYASGLNNRGFIFKNPNAETTCGCGTSFS